MFELMLEFWAPIINPRALGWPWPGRGLAVFGQFPLGWDLGEMVKTAAGLAGKSPFLTDDPPIKKPSPRRDFPCE